MKTLPRTQHATKVKKFVAFSLKLRRSRATALPALCGYRTVGHFLSAEYARALLKCKVYCGAGLGPGDKRHVRRLLLSQLREVNTFFPSRVSVAGTVPR